MGIRVFDGRQGDALGSYDAVLFWIFQIWQNLHPFSGQFQRCQQHDISDVSVDNLADPSCIEVLLKKSITDQLRQGTPVCLGKTGGSLCPVAALLS